MINRPGLISYFGSDSANGDISRTSFTKREHIAPFIISNMPISIGIINIDIKYFNLAIDIFNFILDINR